MYVCIYCVCVYTLFMGSIFTNIKITSATLDFLAAAGCPRCTCHLIDRLLFPPPQAWSFLSHLPVLEVSLSVKGYWEGSGAEQTERPLPAASAGLREEGSWLDVHADQEYVLQVALRRIVQGQQRVSAKPPSHLLFPGHCKARWCRCYVASSPHSIVAM